ncbi:MAG: T9SS type A sorting domain-containing protein, partial [Candidatus Delongbacteria bacterium]|nr:T9SS type A sorting domain-containing protein [Candidatus Delongbacteria bacterium]
GMVAYLVNRQADSLVCAFPVQNSAGAVSSLNYYFLIDSLGQNMYPADTQFVKVRQAAAVGICQPQTNPKTGCILAPNYPNPFNPSTTIQFSINHRAHVVLDLYDMLGHRVKTMIDQLLESGAHQFQLNADDLPSGIYFYRLEIDGRVSDIRKMALLK